MKVTELIAKGGDGEVKAIYCGECGRVFSTEEERAEYRKSFKEEEAIG